MRKRNTKGEKLGPKILLFLPLLTPRQVPVQNFELLYWFDMQHYYFLRKNGFWNLRVTHPDPIPRGHIKIPNVFLRPSSIGLWKFWDFSLNGLGAMVWHYRQTYVRTIARYHNIPAFTPKSAGITMDLIWHTKTMSNFPWFKIVEFYS